MEEIERDISFYSPYSKISINKIGRELMALGFARRSKRVNENVIKVYDCIRLKNVDSRQNVDSVFKKSVYTSKSMQD